MLKTLLMQKKWVLEEQEDGIPINRDIQKAPNAGSLLGHLLKRGIYMTM